MPSERIAVSEYVKAELDRVKDEEQHTTYDSVIRALLGTYEVTA